MWFVSYLDAGYAAIESITVGHGAEGQEALSTKQLQYTPIPGSSLSPHVSPEYYTALHPGPITICYVPINGKFRAFWFPAPWFQVPFELLPA
jgi:hypothetical protein